MVRRQGEEGKVLRCVPLEFRQKESSLRNAGGFPFLDQLWVSTVHGIHTVKVGCESVS